MEGAGRAAFGDRRPGKGLQRAAPLRTGRSLPPEALPAGEGGWELESISVPEGGGEGAAQAPGPRARAQLRRGVRRTLLAWRETHRGRPPSVRSLRHAAQLIVTNKQNVQHP